MTTYRLWRRRFRADLRRPGCVRETAATLAELVAVFAAFVVACLVWPGFLDEPGPMLFGGALMAAGNLAVAGKLGLAISARRRG
jgi:hypothetical protein